MENNESMIMTFNADVLAGAVEWVVKVSMDGVVLMDVGDGSSSVRFRAEGGSGMRSISVPVRIENRRSGTVPFSGPHLNLMAAALRHKSGDGDAVMTIERNPITVPVSYMGLKFPVAVLTSSGRIPSDSERFSPIGSMSYHDFMWALKTAGKLTGRQLTAVSMIDITFDAGTGLMSVMGTDKTVLGVIKAPFIPDDVFRKHKTTRFLVLPDINNLRTDSEDITISESDESLRMDFGGTRVATIRKQRMRMFHWPEVVAHQSEDGVRVNDVSIDVDASALSTSTSIIMSVRGAVNEGVIQFAVKDGSMSIRSTDDDSPVDTITVGYDGGMKRFALHYDELRKIISAVDSDIIRIRYASDSDVPIIIEQLDPDSKVDESSFMMIYPK